MSRTPTDPVGLPDALRDLSDDELAELLRLRPDLLTPLPSDIAQLATRAATRSSLGRVLDRLDRRELAVIEALAVTGEPVSVSGLAALLGITEDVLAPVLAGLRRLGLVWGSDDGLVTAHAMPDLLGSFPAGLGPRGALDLDPDKIEELLDEVGPEGRRLAERLAAGPPVGVFEDPSVRAGGPLSEVLEALHARHLLIRLDSRTVVLPREVGLHLRGGTLFAPGALAPPAPDGPVRDPALVDRTAAGAAQETIRKVEQLLDAWGQEGPSVLKAGGLGVRDLRRVAARLEVDEHLAAFYVEIASAAGLVGRGEDDDDPTWLPAEAYDRWRDRPPATRWAALAQAWLASARVPGLVGTRDDKGRPIAALSGDVVRSGAQEFRRLVLEALAETPEGTVLDAEAVLTQLRWKRPRRISDFVADFVRWTLVEAAALGVTGLGALAGPGRALLESADAAGEALHPLLPEPVDYVLLQADLTAVAPGPLAPELGRSLALMADAESHGGATVYRFSPESVRRALDAGRTAADLHAVLAEHSRTPVPQPLTYLVDDIARRHGHLRAGTATSYLRCDDPTLLESIVADRRTLDLGLRRIAPTVVISRLPLRPLVDELRALGYAPVPEGSDGSLILSTPRAHRAPDPRPHKVTTTGPRAADPALLAAAVRALRAGDRARAVRPDTPSFAIGRTASVDAIRLLRTAATEGWTVWIGYADQHGSTTERVVDPVRIDGGVLAAYDHAAGESRTYLLHRITGVARVE